MEKFKFGFYQWEKQLADQPFLHQPFGETWEVSTWKEVGIQARKLATGLLSLGLPPKSHIGLVSKNCREWIVADIAIIMAGYVSVPFYPTLTGEQIKEVLELGDVSALFVGKIEVWDEMKTGIPEDLPIIKFPHYDGNDKIDRGQDWDEFINPHEPIQGEPSGNLDDIWSIVFTSGTTGTPKGVVLTYRQMDSTKAVTNGSNPAQISLEGANRFFSYLPLNHIAERVVVECTCLLYGGEIFFTESLERFSKNLQHAKPTVFFAVPRIWTKFQLGILSQLPQKKLNLFLKIPILSSIIKKKLKSSLGLENSRSNVSGAAPLSENLKMWFKKIGVEITNGYGMTENCAICTALLPSVNKPGSVGQPQSGTEIKIDQNSGEILMKAPYVMSGYYKNKEKTDEAFADGWLRTGDQGYLDEEGYLFITGRVKDTFKTSKGKFIIPSPMEHKFSNNTDIEQLCIVGLGCPQPLGLIVTSDLGKSKTKENLVTSLNKTLSKANSEFPNYKKISTLVVVKEPWTVENGLLTPTLKVKRNKLNERYRDQLMNWHEKNEEIIIE